MLALLDHTWEQYGFFASCVFSDEGIQNGMDAFLFARPAVPVLPAFHPLECPPGGAAHRAVGPVIGCGVADGLPDAVDEEPHEDENDDSDHGPSAVQRLSRKTRYVRFCAPHRRSQRATTSRSVPFG